MLKPDQIEKLEDLFNSSYSIAEIARITGISVPTINKYKKLILDQDENSYSEVSSKLTPYITSIEEIFNSGVRNSVKIYQILKEEGFSGSYNLVYSYVRNLKDLTNNEKRVTQRVETEPGEQAQVDWGHFGKITIESKVFNLYVFVYVLSYSRMAYAEFVTSQKQRMFQDCHINAFYKLGVPKKIRYDNVKTVVISRNKMANGDEHINFNVDFLNFAKYYRFTPEVCPPYYPKAKGKVEAGVKYVRYNFMDGEISNKTFQSVDELNQRLWRWLEKSANNRVHATTGETPNNRWLIEKDYLFNIEDYPRYNNYFISSRKASRNSMVYFKRSSYWIPHKYAKKKIGVLEINEGGIIKLKFYYQGNKIIEHPMALKNGSWIIPKDVSVDLKKKQLISDKKKAKEVEVESRDLGYYNRYIN